MLILTLIQRKILTMTEMTTVGDDFDETIRTIRLKSAIEKAFEENKDLLERLGSDYDENGKPYWDERA